MKHGPIERFPWKWISGELCLPEGGGLNHFWNGVSILTPFSRAFFEHQLLVNRTRSLLTCMDHRTQLGSPHDFGIKSLGELCGRVLKKAGIWKVWKTSEDWKFHDVPHDAHELVLFGSWKWCDFQQFGAAKFEKTKGKHGKLENASRMGMQESNNSYWSFLKLVPLIFFHTFFILFLCPSGSWTCGNSG